MLRRMVLGIALGLVAVSATRAEKRVPTVDDLINVRSLGSAVISPSGKWVAYTITETDWKQDAFVSHIWLTDSQKRRSFQLTRGDRSCADPQWSPDGEWLAFTSARGGDRNQIYAIRPSGGEAIQLTRAENGVDDYAWSPDGRTMAFVSGDRDDKKANARKDHLGNFEVVRREYSYSHLWTVDVTEALTGAAPGKRRTEGKDFSISGFSWAPDGNRIAFSATVNPDRIHGGTADIYLLSLSDNGVEKIVAQPGPDRNPMWSPDGARVIFSSAMGKPEFYHANSRLAVVARTGGAPRSLTDGFDENPSLIDWIGNAIYFGAQQKTAIHVFRLDPTSERIAQITQPHDAMIRNPSLTKDGRWMAFTAASPDTLDELYISPLPDFSPQRLTTMTDQAKDWIMGTREMISWRSEDGTPIEGVLIKPEDFDPARKYALLCIIHGGPTGVDRPTLLDRRYYPADIWTARGALILKVNYRGSGGYGERFRQLNVRNLGVGDAWDVLSGVDHLIEKGWVDRERVGCMGWSQGGYISAFLTTSSDRFAAISVGAGISNWATYYYNTDITPFTIQYLGTDPAEDPEIYLKTSPMNYIKQARTPTLIQHGEFDQRVPIPNAFELRQGLEDRGVPVEMVVYKGYGHGITKPKSMRAVMEHNLGWFNHYLFGDPLPDFTDPELPRKEGAEKAPAQPK